MTDEPSDEFRFGHFRLELRRRVLSANDQVVPIGARAFDILQLLVAHRDRVVTRDEILHHAWPGIVVDPANLGVQMSSLRRALGNTSDASAYIVTIAGRGYQFVGQLSGDANEPRAEPPDKAPRPLRHSVLLDSRLLFVSLLAAAAVFVCTTLWLRQAAPFGSRPRLSIVVLPFRNLSDDRRQNYLADAITDDLTTDLFQMTGSLVISRETADTYKSRNVPITQIGRDLQVRYALEGSLRLDGDIMRVNAQLNDAETGLHIWADHFNIKGDSLSGAQTTIENRIAESLGFELFRVESERSWRERSKNADALDLYLRARSILGRAPYAPYDLPLLLQGQSLLEQAISLQPNFIDAMTDLEQVLIQKSVRFKGNPNTMADYQRAMALIDKVLALEPNNITALFDRARDYGFRGRYADAEQDARVVTATSPDGYRSPWIAAVIAHLEGKNPESIKYWLTTFAKFPASETDSFKDYFKQFLGLSYIEAGNAELAIDTFQQIRAGSGRFFRPTGDRGIADYAFLGLISANSLAGNSEVAHMLYNSYRKAWPNRTIWGLAEPRLHREAEANLHSRYNIGLRQAGMPDFVDETVDSSVAPTSWLENPSDLASTPLKVPGATTIDTRTFQAMRAQKSPPLVIDCGAGAAVPEGAVWPWTNLAVWVIATSVPMVHDVVRQNTQGSKGTPVVIMGDGPFGSLSYNAASRLVQDGYTKIYWYRGGEQSWVQAGLPAQDLRP